ncbi:Pycsar system effector family protein [uncultured Winogradskyella sp.]|uniref:Pycsar system effector family protein n=1 Tax=uncultured Winogradskyella sp. TaxID=395353 RepID=UPI00260CB43F|nr:Pycsar system effector family protein [uncultured Winogradskyella sp.]
MSRQDPNNYWEQLERLEKLIRASELKAGVLFSFHSLILGLFADRLDTFKDVFVSHTFMIILLVCWLLLVGISIFYCFRCFRPSMDLSYKKNVFFFRDAANMYTNTEDYTEELIRICGSEKELYQKLAEQIHAESKIIDRKFLNVRRSIATFAFSFLVLVIMGMFWGLTS